LAVLRPQVEVVAVEADPGRADFARRNRERFEAYSVRVVNGSAPGVLREETARPRAVFVGGSGGELAGILDLAAERMLDGGILVASFVVLENLALLVQRLRDWGWPFDATELHVARSDSLAGLTGLKPLRGVFLVRAQKHA
jgi:precorrin-6B methylase 2